MYSVLKKEFRPDEGEYHFSFDKHYPTKTEYQIADNRFFYYVKDDNNKIIPFTIRKYELHFSFFLDQNTESKDTKIKNKENLVLSI